MKTSLNAQEVFLIERYLSIDYLQQMRIAWSKVLDLVEQALCDYMRQLPPDYRSRPLHEQPDMVWGERVLPNFRDTMIYIDMACKKLEAGDYSGLHGASEGILGDWRGVREFWIGWMDEKTLDLYYTYYSLARMYARNVQFTIRQRFDVGFLTFDYQESQRGPLALPESLPVYRLNPKITVATGQLIPRTGIYLPDADDCAANFLMEGEGKLAPEAEACANTELYYATKDQDEDISKESKYVPVTWTLIERVSDTGTPTALSTETFRLRCEAGKPCPKQGWWWSPAGGAAGRRFFKEGEIMPAFGSDYGDTIWQWDEKQ